MKASVRSKRLKRELAQADMRLLRQHERESSVLRHSVVEASFSNLKLWAQSLPEKSDPTEIVGRIKADLERVPALEARVEQYFGFQISNDHPLRRVFSEEYWTVKRSFSILKTAALHLGDAPKPHQVEFVSHRIPIAIDAIMEALKGIDESIKTLRTDLNDFLRGLERLHMQKCLEAGVRLLLDVGTQSLPKLYLNTEKLVDVMTELIRNALKHAFPSQTRGEKNIRIGAAAKPTAVEIIVEDNGIGMREDESRSGKTVHGIHIATRTVRDELQGQIEWSRARTGGTRVTVSIPL